MSKSILVIDKPECCDYCPVGRIFGMTGQVECMEGKDIRVNNNGSIIPDWCPLLPCAIGDTVYEVQDLRKRIQPYTIIAVHISNCGNLYGWELKDGKGVYSNVNGFSEDVLGKSVFPSREEAEVALKELERGKG